MKRGVIFLYPNDWTNLGKVNSPSRTNKLCFFKGIFNKPRPFLKYQCVVKKSPNLFQKSQGLVKISRRLVEISRRLVKKRSNVFWSRFWTVCVILLWGLKISFECGRSWVKIIRLSSILYVYPIRYLRGVRSGLKWIDFFLFVFCK